MKIVIRPHDLGKGTADELGKKARGYGFDGVQLAIAKAIVGQSGNPGTLTPEVIDEIRHGFEDNAITIPILGAYFNPVHSNRDKVIAGQEKYADHLRHAKEFGALYVSSETGSYNDEPWTYNPRNQTEEAFQAVKAVFTPLAHVAEESGAVMVLEGAWGHCMYKPEQMRRLIDEIDTGAVKTIVDMLNYLYIENYQDREKLFYTCLDLFQGKIAAFHLKDFIVADGAIREVPLGDGIMGWDTFLPVISNSVPDAYLVFEGVPDVAKSFSFVHSVIG
jgi:L-ribulose-5-phosphate 3-epimerase